MVDRIGDHLTYLAMYATSFQNSEQFQKVCLMYCNIYIVLFLMAIFYRL